MAGAGISFFFGEAVAKKTELIHNLERHGRKATGRTSAAIREEHSDTGFELYGPKHVYTFVYGRGPSKVPGGGSGSLLENIKEWIAAKGLKLNPYAVTAKIHKQGTRLFIQIKNGGQPSKVLEEVFGNGYQQELQERVKASLFLQLREQLLEASSNIQKF